MIIGSKNKGDWSEFYVLLYLLGKRELYAADAHLNRIETYYFPINKIMRKDKPTEKVDFLLENVDKVKIYFNSTLAREMTSKEFMDEADFLLTKMKSGKGSFNISQAEAFLNSIHLYRLAAPPSDVTDIQMEVHDTNTGINQVMGFSIKSYIGNTPTLLNASGATNFIYEVQGLSDSQINDINAIKTNNKILDRMNKISSDGGSIRYLKMANDVFAGNLLMIDSRMEELLAKLILYSYTKNETDCAKIIEYFEHTNPLGYPRKGIYTYKFKEFLCAKALGMDPSKEWSGEDSANGGYVVAKSNGEVLAYHLYNRDDFKQYLFDNVKLERASTSRHNYASLYKEGNRTLLNLNLQIRFK